jgi:hypothetical protein
MNDRVVWCFSIKIKFKVLKFILKRTFFSPVSLSQLIGQLHYIYREPVFESRSFHLSILRPLDYLTKKKKHFLHFKKYKYMRQKK